jgi:hypothetical protein
MDRDWPLGSVAVAAFLVLVAALLGAVLRWRAPFTAWLAISVFVLAFLALQALALAAGAAWRRAWRSAVTAAALGVLFAACLLSMSALGRHAPPERPAAFDDVLAERGGGRAP